MAFERKGVNAVKRAVVLRIPVFLGNSWGKCGVAPKVLRFEYYQNR
jgi:hypothetical protein